MAQAQAGSRLLKSPDDVIRRLLAGLPRDSLNAADLVCRAFHAVIADPQFPAFRQNFGFAERGIGFDGPGDAWSSTLKIFDIASGAWHLGAPIPEGVGGRGERDLRAVALDGKLYCIGLLTLSCYDPQADASGLSRRQSSPGKIWRETLASNSSIISESWRLFLTRAGSWSSYRTAQLSSEPRTAPGPATKSPREPFPTTGLTTCTPRPSARDMQVSLSRYRLGFTL